MTALSKHSGLIRPAPPHNDCSDKTQKTSGFTSVFLQTWIIFTFPSFVQTKSNFTTFSDPSNIL